MRYGDSLSSLSLASSYTEGISLFYDLRLGGLTFQGGILVCMRRALSAHYKFQCGPTSQVHVPLRGTRDVVYVSRFIVSPVAIYFFAVIR
jgi:hypothetical protein